MSINELDNTGMAIQVSETSPGSSGIKIEPKEEDCEDLLSAFLVDPPPVKIEKDEIDDNRDEYGTLSEDYSVNIEKLKAEHSEDSNECLIKPPIKSEENDQDQDQDDAFTEESNIKNEEMDIKEDDESIDEPGNSPNSYDRDAKKICTRKKRRTVVRQCPECEFTTTIKRKMSSHLTQHKRKRELANGFPCPKCDFKTTRICYLRAHFFRHINTEQTTEYNCDICEYKTLNNNNIKHHLQVHRQKGERTPEIMLKCSHCDFETKYKKSLKFHLLRHLGSEQATAYNCDICKYTTIYKSHIDRHLQAHATKRECTPQTSFECDQCDFTTKYKYYLEKHSLQHEDDTMFKCYQCSYETQRKINLYYHLRHHRKESERMLLFKEHLRLRGDSQNATFQQTTENVLNSVDNYKFKCQHCDYKTNWTSSFTTHLKQHDTPKKKRVRQLQ